MHQTFANSTFSKTLFLYLRQKGISPDVFNDDFNNIEHKYPTRFSENNYSVPQT